MISVQTLDIVMKKNKFVASILLSNKPRLDWPSFYGLGDENEAKYYTGFAAYIWKNTKYSTEWLKKQCQKP